MKKKTDIATSIPALFDRYLLLAVFSLIAIGLIMVTSASMMVAERNYHESFYFLYRQGFFLLIGLVAILILVKIRMSYWRQLAFPLFILAIFLLILVLIPGIGRMVNGSRRWLGIGFMGLQVSEFAKLSMILYIASYLTKYAESVRTHLSGFIKPIALLAIVSLLLLLQPDFGATVVIGTTVLCMLFLGGVQLRNFLVLLVGIGAAFILLAISEPYRLKRLTSFLDPWSHAFSSGYQLTQALIAFGRGGFWGVGLGESVQKLFYLPEAHTDFLFAVLAEELGFLGVATVIGLFGLMLVRILLIGRKSQVRGQFFSAYVAYGIATWLGIQAVVNMGVNAGIFPTKGLTLPFISYGGSSLLIDCVAIGLLLRIDHETRLSILGLSENIRKMKSSR